MAKNELAGIAAFAFDVIAMASLYLWGDEPAIRWAATAAVVIFTPVLFFCVAALVLRRRSLRRSPDYVPARKVIKYLENEATWGWRTWGEARSSEVVSLLAPSEFNSKAKDGLLRSKGFSRHAGAYVDIDPVEWRGIQIDTHSVINPDTDSSTTEVRHIFASNVKNYDDVMVLWSDVEKTWPRAKLFYKLIVLSKIALRRLQALAGRIKDQGRASC